MFLKLVFALLLIRQTVWCEEAINETEETDSDHAADESLVEAVEKEGERLHEKRSLQGPGVGFGGGPIGFNLIDPLATVGFGGPLLGQQIEVTNQVAVPVIGFRDIPVPVPQPVPVAVHVPVRIPHPVPVPVYKKVPVPVEKPVPVFVPKPFPVKIVKKIPIPRPFPVPVPVYKTRHIYHIAHAYPKHHGWW